MAGTTSTQYLDDDNAILGSLDAQELLRQGLTTNPSRGTRKLHKRRLERSSDEENHNIPLPSSLPGSNLASSSSGASPNAYATIPDLLISQETMVYLGFTEDAAEEIWTQWANWPRGDDGREIDNGPVTFLSMATARIRAQGTDTTSDNDEEWTTTMSTCGINTELREAILDSYYKSVRLTESCKFWLLDTIRVRYRGLLEIRKASRERDMVLHREALRPRQQSTQAAPRSISATLRAAPGVSLETGVSAVVRQRAPGHTVLYKGCDQARIVGMFDDNGQVTSMTPLDSSLRGDFNSRNAALYWTVDWEIAMRYACWAKRLASYNSVVIIRTEVPNAAIESLGDDVKLQVYWPNLLWKKLVWNCRQCHRLRNELAKFSQATLIIGTICNEPGLVIGGLDSSDDITERMVLRNPQGGFAVQYVFLGDRGLDFMEEHSMRKVTVHPLTSEEIRQAVVGDGDLDQGRYIY